MDLEMSEYDGVATTGDDQLPQFVGDDGYTPSRVDRLNQEVGEFKKNSKAKAAFKKRIRKEDDIVTWGDFFDEQMAVNAPDMIVNSIDIETLPRWFQVVLILFYAVGSIGLLGYFTYTGVQGGISAKYISLDGSSDIQDCTTVPKSVTGSFGADSYGKWSSDSAYQANAEIYSLEFEASTLNIEEYETSMATFDASLKALGQRVGTRDLIFSIIAWTTLTLYDTDKKLTFSTTADIPSIFKSLELAAFEVYSSNGYCDPTALATTGSTADGSATGALMMPPSFYIHADGEKVEFSFELEVDDTDTDTGAFDMSQDPMFLEGFSPCIDQFDPIYTFDYNENNFEYSGGEDTKFAMTLDLRSIFTAVSINYGIMPLSSMIEVRSTVSSMYDYLIDTVNYKFYVDPTRAPMTPIVCVPKGTTMADGSTINTADFCLIQMGTNFVYPAMWSKSDDEIESANYCTCDTYGSMSDSQRSYCNQMWFQLALVYDKLGLVAKAASGGTPTYPIFDMATTFSGYMNTYGTAGDTYINNAIKPIAVTATTATQFGTLCPANDCGAIVMTFAPIDDTVFPFTENNLQLSDLANSTFLDDYTYANRRRVFCSDTLYQDESISNITSTTPTELVETFYECSKTFGQAFTDSVGNASASAGLYMGLMFLSFLFLLRKIMNLGLPKRHKSLHPKVLEYREQKKMEHNVEVLQKVMRKVLVELNGNKNPNLDVSDPVFDEIFHMDGENDQEPIHIH